MKDWSIEQVLLELDDLTVIFPTRRGTVKAVDGLSFKLHQGEKLGIVGESGSGKSVTMLSILSLIPYPGEIVDGAVNFKEQNIMRLSSGQIRAIRGKEIAMIFQDPMTTLNPAFQIGNQIQESLRIHDIIPRTRGLGGLFDKRRRDEEFDRVLDAMEDVGIPLPEQNASRFPHQFSGGMQQRALTAIALSCEPQILLADEPTTALDVTIQAQIMALLDKINTEHGTSIILVTHNLGLVAEFCDTIVVMYAGQMMEKGEIDQIVQDPKHPYTMGLLRCLPRISDRREKINPIPGLVPDLADLPPGCPFSPRCDMSFPECTKVDTVPLKQLADGRLVRCLLY